MDERPESESMYHRWLEIPIEYCPPNHYILLGVEEFETDESAIAEAAKKRTAYLHQIASGPGRKEVQKLLGEVAVAKRTLLNADSRTEYNDWLTAPEEEEIEQPAVSVVAEQPRTTKKKSSSTKSGTTKKTSASKKGTRPGKKKSAWDEYKLHAISASVLLGVVGVVWFVNSGGGGRRASQAGPVSTPSGPGFRAPTGQKTSKQAAARKRTPPKRPSGLQAPDLNMSTTPKKEPATPKKEAATPKKVPKKTDRKPRTKRPKKGNLNPPAKPGGNYVLPDNWRESLPVKFDFASDYASDFSWNEKGKFHQEPGTKKLFVDGEAEELKPAILKHKKLMIKPGEAVSIAIKLNISHNQHIQVGMDVANARVAIAANKNKDGYQIFTRANSENAVKAVDHIEVAKNPRFLTLILVCQENKDIRWIVDTGDKVQSGVVMSDGVGDENIHRIVFTSPARKIEVPVWFAKLRHGTWPK